MKLVFFGTPDFASAQLEAIHSAGHIVLAAVTAPDKPAGRGRKMTSSAVKQFALAHNITVLQPEKLRDESFLKKLQSLNAEVFVVVAFRMLPEVVWKMPPKGTFNLHASLLPQYRGAAPINWAIINGETTTGLTTFFINEKIDEGNIILQHSMPIGPNENAGSLHSRMMVEGKELALNTLQLIADNKTEAHNQDHYNTHIERLKAAPKIFRSDCLINWSKSLHAIHNHIRGLSPYPAAYTYLKNEAGMELEIKVLMGSASFCLHDNKPLMLVTDNKKQLNISHKQGYYAIQELKLPGKRAMGVAELLRGFSFEGQWRVCQ